MSGGEMGETIFRWGRIQENGDWLLPMIVFVLLLLYFVRRYRLDAVDLKSWQRSLLLTMRIAVLGGLFLYYLHPQWENLVGSSRIIILVDSSASMANRDVDHTNHTRLDAALHWLEESQLVEKLAEQHDVMLFHFDEGLHTAADQNSHRSPDGTATALGDALYETLQRERGQPLAGIILISDGGHNSGRNLETPLETAARLRIPIFPIGVGQTHPPLNYRVGNIDVPDRVMPNDPFIVKVPVEKIGGESTHSLLVDHNADNRNADNRRVSVELSLDDTVIETREVVFLGGGIIETSFQIRVPAPGLYRLAVEVIPPLFDSQTDRHADANPDDNRQQIEFHAIDRKDRILLFASSPTRDYQFFCAQLFRDQTVELDVYLPWSQSGITQSADRILDRFPATRSGMSEYDVLIAFDPDWRHLSPEQIDIFEHWVARQGGGLILIAGPVHQADTITGWVTDPGMDTIRALYPVEFLARTASFDHRYRNSPVAHSLIFSREGEMAGFLRITDEQGNDTDFWEQFPGYFGHFAVRGVKPTATLLVSSGSPDAMTSVSVNNSARNEGGAMIVEQFYGAGRVLYFGSGELWRLRRIDDAAFEQIVTKIVRHVGQGRLQRESDRGALTLDRQRYPIGSLAQIRITANDLQLNPLTLPAVPIEVISPSGMLRMIDVLLDSNTPGLYQTFLPLDTEGTWTVQWMIPDSEQQVVRTIQVHISDLEREHPNRNETLLQEIAERSGGVYFPQFELAETLPGRIGIRSQRAVVDEQSQEHVFYYLLLAICTLLLLEWTCRRLMHLA